VVPIAINVSSLEFRSERFAEGVALALKKARLSGRYLEIELTETALMTHAGSAATALAQIHELGVRLALDDFGTGYSSLSYLTKFTIDAVKIDRSFVHSINTTEADTVVATTIISLAKRLHHRVIAEGVETPGQLAYLQAEGCDEGQGYYLGRPMVAEEFVKLLALPVETAPWASVLERPRHASV
jgi:EAL domain-containing protein (putative c-di-GMP-specific phosphodiesterase class I)